MAIAYVQSNKGNPTGISTTTVQLTLVAAGNLLIISGDWTTAGRTLAVSDSQGQTVTPVLNNQSWNGASSGAGMFYIANANAGTHTITFTWTGGTVTFTSLYVAEYSGADTSSPLDTQVFATGTSTALDSGNLTTAVANEMGFAYLSIANGPSLTVGAGYTFRTPNSTQASRIEDNLPSSVAAGGSLKATATGSSSNNWMVLFGLFKPAGGAAVGTTTNFFPFFDKRQGPA